MPIAGVSRPQRRSRRKRKPYMTRKDTNIVKYTLGKTKAMIHNNIEDKNYTSHVSTWTNVPAMASATIAELLTIAQGTDDNDRIGRDIKGRYLKFNWIFKTIATTPTGVRLIIFYWNDDTVPVISDILSNTEVQSILSNDERPKRGRVVYDNLRMFSGTSGSRSANVVRLFKRINNIKTSYTSGTSTSGIRGKLYYMLGASSTDVVQFQNSFTYYFEDA